MDKRTARLCFVSSPYASIKCKHERDRGYYARKLAEQACTHRRAPRRPAAAARAERACAIVRANGCEPISPVLAWMGVYSELERERIMKNCEELLSVCSYYYFFACEGSENSKGMAYERELARQLGVRELKFSLFD